MDVNGIANLSMAMSQYNLKEAIGVSVLKMAMETSEIVGQQLIEMGDLAISEGIDIKI